MFVCVRVPLAENNLLHVGVIFSVSSGRVLARKMADGKKKKVSLSASSSTTMSTLDSSDRPPNYCHWWDHNNWRNFINMTDLHGWVFLDNAIHVSPALRICWCLLLIFAFFALFALILMTLSDYHSDYIVTTYADERGHWKNVYFPSVTVCNINRARKSFFYELGFNESAFLQLLPVVLHLYGEAKNVSSGMADAVTQLVRLPRAAADGRTVAAFKRGCHNYSHMVGGSGCAEAAPGEFRGFEERNFMMAAVSAVGQSTVLRAQFKDVSLNADSLALLHPFFETDFGFCSYVRPQVMFNVSEVNSRSFSEMLTIRNMDMRPGIQLGSANGLKLLLDAEVFDYGYSIDQHNEGFKIGIQHYLDQPHMDMSPLEVSPGRSAFVSVTPILHDTSAVARKRFDPDDRQCYFNDEFRLRHLDTDRFRYSFNNCILEAAYDEIYKECNCTLTTHHGEGGEDDGAAEPAVSDVSAKKKKSCNRIWAVGCKRHKLKNVGVHEEAEDIDGRTRMCYSACQDQLYSTQMITTKFPNENLLSHDLDLFCVILRKVQAVCRVHSRRVLLEKQLRHPNVCAVVAGRWRNCSAGGNWVAEDFFSKTDEAKGEGGGNATAGEREWSEDVKSVVYRYAVSNVVSLNVVVKDTTVTSILRDEKQPVIWLLANLGGVSGLIMGFSLVTLFEVLFFLVNLVSLIVQGKTQPAGSPPH